MPFYFRRMLAVFVLVFFAIFVSSCSFDPDSSPTPMLGQSIGKPFEMQYAEGHIFTLNCDLSQSFNPVSSNSPDNLLLAPLLYESMFEVTENYSYTPVLCSDFETSDGKTYIFYIDSTRTFSDGSPLTAQDVRMSVWRAWTSPGFKQRLEILLGIDALSESMLMVTLKYPNTQFPALLNIPVYKYNSPDANTPLGTGSYMLNEDKTMLIKNPYHPNFDYMPIDNIALIECKSAEELIAAFEGLELDLVTNDPTGQGYLGYGGLNETRSYATTLMHYIGYNFESVYMRYDHFRYAVGLAINRNLISSSAMNGSGVPATLPILPLSYLYNQQLASTLDFSLEKCAAVLDAADIIDFDKDGFREMRQLGSSLATEPVFIVNNENAVKIAAAREIAKSLESIGVKVNLRELSWDNYTAALADGDFDMYYGEVRLTPDFDLTQFLTEGGSLNFGSVKDPAYVAYLYDYLSASEEDRQYFADIMFRYISETAPITPIVFEKKQVLTHIGAARGLVPTQYNIFNKFSEWTIDFGHSADAQSNDTQ